MHERMKRQDVDEDHRVEAEHPRAEALALLNSTVHVPSPREQYTQQYGEGDDKRGVTRAEEVIQPRQKRHSFH